MNKFDSILKQNKEIKDFHMFDVDAEWNNFLASVNEPLDDNITPTKTIKKGNSILFYLSFAAAACFVLVVAFTLVLRPEPKL